MIAVSVEKRATTRSKSDEVATPAAPAPNAVVSATATPVLSDASGERHAMIAEAAYYIAELRGFDPGHELEDWLCAEREISGKLA